MINLDKLQQSWQGQLFTDPENIELLKNTLEQNSSAERKRLFRSNIWTSAGYLTGITCFGILYFNDSDKYGWPFALSLSLGGLLLITYFAMMWLSYTSFKEQPQLPSVAYVTYQLKYLNWQRVKLKTLTYIFAAVIWIGAMLYFSEVANDKGRLWQGIIMCIVTGFITKAYLFDPLNENKTQLRIIDNISDDLLALRQKLAG
jgi:MFS family permease